MMVWLWALIGILALVVIALLVKIHMLQKAAEEIGESFADRLQTDTNTLIHISSRDRHMRRLARAVNVQLRRLRAQRRRFQQGDTELKNAVTNISHDLRTPLTAICGYLDLLEQEEKSEAAAQYLCIIRNRTDMLNHLTEELFQYSVILAAREDEAREEVVVNHLLEESIAAFYGVLLAHGITPHIRIPEEKVVRVLDSSRPVTSVRQSAEQCGQIQQRGFGNRPFRDGEIAFSNSAARLDSVQVGRLFDRFYTVESARNSTGLGLSIARHLTEQMGGTIGARYEDGRLSVLVTLPDA